MPRAMRPVSSGSPSSWARSRASRGGGLLGQVVLEQGQPVQTRGQGHQVPGPGGAVDDAGDQTLQVRDLPQHLDQLLPLHSVVHQPAHRLQPAGDGHRVQQRALQPAAEEPAAHGGLGLVQHPEQGALFLLAPEGFGELQVPPGHRVQLQKAAGGVVSEGPQVGQVGLLGFVQIGEQSPRRLYGGLGLRRDLVQPRGELSLHPLPGLRQGQTAPPPACSTRQGSFPDRWSSSPLSRAPGERMTSPGGQTGPVH